MNREINHKTMRLVIGAIAILIALVVRFFSGKHDELTSISISYWSDARDIFVGSLVAVGFYLAAYNGNPKGRNWDLEFYLAKFAGAFAVLVALFPTDGFTSQDVPPSWTTLVTGVIGCQPKHIHGFAAICLFACLIVMMWFFSVRASDKKQYIRSNWYRLFAVSMVLGIPVLFGLGSVLKWSNTLYWVEFWELICFGSGWILAGSYKSIPPAG